MCKNVRFQKGYVVQYYKDNQYIYFVSKKNIEWWDGYQIVQYTNTHTSKNNHNYYKKYLGYVW